MALVGIGLIGSSIARAARAANLARTIVAIDRDPAVVARVQELGIADVATTDLAAGVADADLIILSIPVGAFAEVAARMAPSLKPGAIVSDTGSVKASIIAQTTPHLP
ncbi:MAG TPA: prephenate dehydrogenase/arogenate dehydrogenase family protein, partial [Methylobacterium sp.]|nr:prephenate dehydrogenase/arogenate dehydrogenase family protein [Methylobacterium sp.]